MPAPVTKYTTLVFRKETPADAKVIGELSQHILCRAWSLDHEILRLELIEKALEENDIEKAKTYFGEIDVTRFLHELDA